MGFVGQILIKLETSFILGFVLLSLWYPLGSKLGKHAVATQWPLERAPHFQQSVWYGGLEAHWSYLRYVYDADTAILVNRTQYAGRKIQDIF